MTSPAGERETGVGARAQRADARANRVRILDVAEEVFSKGGESASTEEVARLARVGIATVFRHFPTKAALLEAVLARRFERLRQQAEELADANDPGQAFLGFFRYLVADAPAKIGIAEALLEAGGDDGAAARASNELRQAFGALLRQAQQAAVIRDDVELPEVYALLVGVSQAATREQFSEDVRARVLTIVFDGLAPRAVLSGNRDLLLVEGDVPAVVLADTIEGRWVRLWIAPRGVMMSGSIHGDVVILADALPRTGIGRRAVAKHAGTD